MKTKTGSFQSKTLEHENLKKVLWMTLSDGILGDSAAFPTKKIILKIRYSISYTKINSTWISLIAYVIIKAKCNLSLSWHHVSSVSQY